MLNKNISLLKGKYIGVSFKINFHECIYTSVLPITNNLEKCKLGRQFETIKLWEFRINPDERFTGFSHSLPETLHTKLETLNAFGETLNNSHETLNGLYNMVYARRSLVCLV